MLQVKGRYVYLKREDYAGIQWDIANFNMRMAQLKERGLAKARELQKTGLRIEATSQSKEVMEIIKQLDDEKFLDSLFDAFIEGVNRELQNTAGDKERKFINDINTVYDTVLNNGQIQDTTKFLNDLIKVAKSLNNNTLVNAIINYKKGTPISLSASGADAQQAQKIIQQIDDLMNKNFISRQNFTNTMRDIMSTKIGEKLGAETMERAINSKVETEVMQVLTNVFGTNVSSVNTNKAYTVSGQTQLARGGNIKVDAFNSEALKFTIATESNETVTITLATNISIKQYATRYNTSGEITKVHVSTNILKKVLEVFYALEGNNAEVQRYILNTLARSRTQVGSKEMEEKGPHSFIAAAFLTEQVMGSGEQIASKKLTDAAQYLFVNGKLYSTYDLIERAYKDLEFKHLGDRITVSISQHGRAASLANSFINDPTHTQAGMIAAAFQRSKKVIDLLEQVKVSASIKLS